MLILYLLFCYLYLLSLDFFIFFFNDPATTEIYTLSLHDALPISAGAGGPSGNGGSGKELVPKKSLCWRAGSRWIFCSARSEEHTSELQSHSDLVCRLLLEKKKKNKKHDEILGETALYNERRVSCL